MTDNTFPKSINGNKPLKTAISVALLIIICVIILRVYKGVKATSNVIGNAVGNEIIAAQLNMSTARVVYIRSEATRLWNKGVWSILWIRNYNEDMFIATINTMVTDGEVRLLDQFYQENSGERLRDVINNSFNSSEKARINATWLAVLNS